jgi:hypothetical protein
MGTVHITAQHDVPDPEENVAHGDRRSPSRLRFPHVRFAEAVQSLRRFIQWTERTRVDEQPGPPSALPTPE